MSYDRSGHFPLDHVAFDFKYRHLYDRNERLLDPGYQEWWGKMIIKQIRGMMYGNPWDKS